MSAAPERPPPGRTRVAVTGSLGRGHGRALSARRPPSVDREPVLDMKRPRRRGDRRDLDKGVRLRAYQPSRQEACTERPAVAAGRRTAGSSCTSRGPHLAYGGARPGLFVTFPDLHFTMDEFRGHTIDDLTVPASTGTITGPIGASSGDHPQPGRQAGRWCRHGCQRQAGSHPLRVLLQVSRPVHCGVHDRPRQLAVRPATQVDPREEMSPTWLSPSLNSWRPRPAECSTADSPARLVLRPRPVASRRRDQPKPTYLPGRAKAQAGC